MRKKLTNFSEFTSKGLYRSSEKEKESRCLVFTPSTKREIRQFHVVVVQRRQRKVQKSVTHVQSASYCFFCCSCCRRSRRCLSSLLSRLDRVDPAGTTKLLIDLTC